jgi:hypothetical protein
VAERGDAFDQPGVGWGGGIGGRGGELVRLGDGGSDVGERRARSIGPLAEQDSGCS